MLRALSLCTCCRQYPGAATGRRLRSSRPAVSAFPEVAVGSACTSTFSELARRSLALRPAHSRRHLYVTSYTEGFSHFVTSMTAPVASGWSVRRVGLAPTGKRRLLTAHARKQPFTRRRGRGLEIHAKWPPVCFQRRSNTPMSTCQGMAVVRDFRTAARAAPLAALNERPAVVAPHGQPVAVAPAWAAVAPAWTTGGGGRMA